MFDIPCIIFAGGKSSRMGEDKSLLPFGTFNTLTEFQLFRLKKLFKNVYVSCKDKSKFDFEANFIEDIKTDATFAPTTGFMAAFRELKEDSFFVLSVDTPFVSKDEIQILIDANVDANVDAIIAKTASGIQPMCGIYHRSLEDKFVEMLKDDNHRLGYLLKSSKTIFVDFSNDKAFLNLNYQHQYKEALNLI